MLAETVRGSDPMQWLAAVGIAAAALVMFLALLRLVRIRVRAWASTTSGHLDDAIVEVLHATGGWFVVAIALLAGTQVLTLPARAEHLLGRVFTLAVILQTGIWLNAGVRTWLHGYLRRKRATDSTGVTTAAILGFIVRGLLWALVLLMMLDNLGFDITALVAGLGIGGVAVALAVQSVLGDVFASLAIALDKPVVIGDFIVVGDVMGTVERVGLKTTHLRSLSGELVILSNADLLNSRIRNFKRMYERRVVFRFGVTYRTPPEKLVAVTELVRRLVEAEALARLDRVHFATLGASALEFEVVFFVCDPDYGKYMDVQQRINVGLLRGLSEAGIGFAYPTQTIHVVSPADAVT